MFYSHIMRLIVATAGLAAGGLVASLPADASPILFCKDGPGIDLVTDGCISGTSDAYPGGGDGIYTSAGGGDFESAVELAVFGATGVNVDLTALGKSDEGAPFTFTPDSGGSLVASFSGTWTQTSGAGNVSFITVKAANSFALYEFAPTSTGVYTTEGILNDGGQQPTVSHISFWAGAPATPPPDMSAIPEPSSLLLFGSGALGLFWLRRKRRV